LSKRRLAALIADATVDCYSESEAVTGFFTMIEDHLDLPFSTVVLGVGVEVTGVEPTEREEIVAACVCGKQRQRIPICDLPLPSPPPAGAEWIAAYRHWTACG
jgi:hypothetical protein